MMITKRCSYSILLFLCLLQFSAFGQSFTSREVIITTKNDTIQIGATITSPKGKGRFPALVIASGTGVQDRDGTMGGTKMFAQIAEHLSQHGYIVLRMDDRGTGQTTGDYEKATTEDFANDLLEALDFLKTYPQVDKRKLGLLGHSEGGASISIAASKSSDIKFLISLAGLATGGLESLLVQNETLIAQSPMSEIDKKRANEINRLMFTTVYQYADADSLERILNDTYDFWKKKDDLFFQTLGIEHDHFRFPIWRYTQQATGPWYRYFIRYNPGMVLSRVDIPILAINGDKDPFVTPINLSGWQQYSLAGKNGKVTTKLLPNVNHLLQECKTCDPKESAQLGPMPISTLTIITDWLAQTI